jgi:hypothetical protein
MVNSHGMNLKPGVDGLFVVRDKNHKILATTTFLTRANAIRKALYARENRFSDVLPFKPRNGMELEIGKKLMIK